jgi:hypothetical protein
MLKKFFLFSFLLLVNSEALELKYTEEIAHLLTYVKNTSCKYIRNGDAHDGVTAEKHIQKKYDYYKDDICSTEDFIRLSATKSTMFGRKYYIKCAGDPKVESRIWLLKELERYRQNKPL